jgi:signal transduction histidine kinase
MVTDMLSLKRIEAGAFEFRMREASLRDVVLKAAGLYQYSAMAEQIELKQDFNHDQDMLTVDEDRLVSAVQVLVENAIRYSHMGGTVTISTKEDAAHICISVRDEGWGIPEEELPKIFEKYFRGKIPHERMIEGTGIGLTIAKYIVERHRGRILVDTTLGKGSTFTIQLPCRQEVANDR